MGKRETSRLEVNRQRGTVRIVMFGALLLFGQSLMLWAPSLVRAEQSYETYFRYLNDYPNHKELGWAYHVQGATHDDDHWYITQEARVWRFPVTLDLNSVDLPFSAPGVTFRNLITVEQLWGVGYGHLGDPTYYKYGDRGYLLIPLEYNDDLNKHKPVPRPAIGVFRYDPSVNQIVYVAHSEVPQTPHEVPPNDAAWCAVDPAGYLYSSNYDDASTIFRYHVDWDLLQGTRPELKLTPEAPLTLRDEGGSAFALQKVQGGEISPDGQLFYFVAKDLHVFNMSTGRRVRQSTNGSGWFNYEVRGGTFHEIPEGMGLWDLDDGRAPGIHGQLHVFLLNYDISVVWFKHYDWGIDVDGSAGTDKRPAPFPFTFPFKTVGVAQSQIWDGAHINIRAGSYPEKLTLSKPMKLVAKGGTVTIGR